MNFRVCALQSFGAISASYGVPGMNGFRVLLKEVYGQLKEMRECYVQLSSG